MVRTTIACAFCRRSKIKCIHDGVAPCRNCLKGGRTDPGDCVLSGPFANPDRQSNRRVRQRSQRSMPETNVQSPTDASYRSVELAGERGVDFDDPRLSDQLGSPLKTVCLQAATVYSRKFPELAFLHIPSLSFRLSKPSSETHLQPITAILALCTRFLSDPNDRSGRAAEEYAEHTRGFLAGSFVEPPRLETVQALLVISMYEWGKGNGYKAWMYSGMATRMMQSLTIIKRDRHVDAITSEIENRTYWSCFILDRMIFSGVSQPLALPLASMKIPFPVGDQDFAFGRSSVPRYTQRDLAEGAMPSEIYGTVDCYYNVLVRGFDIWARVLKFNIQGGRRGPLMSAPQNCPWAASSTWNVIFGDLKHWRQCQSERLKYGESFIAAQVSLGHGEAAAYVNLIYYLCILFLRREYIPFLPTPESEPRGPVDPPLLEAVAPTGWWEENSRELFEAAACITKILQELEDCGAPLMTPFAGFCAFQAATLNFYVSRFPRMNLGRSSEAVTLAAINKSYLHHFKELWPMGEGWYKMLQSTEILLTRAIVNRAEYQGKTRDDFVTLDASIHDFTGVSSPEDEIQQHKLTTPAAEDTSSNTDRAAALSLQKLAAGSNGHCLEDSSVLRPRQHNVSLPWTQEWPYWGDQPLMPFAVGGLPFDFNMDFSLGQEFS